MKLFGIEIRRAKQEDSTGRELGMVATGSEMMVRMAEKKLSMYDVIIFPHLDLSDPMTSTLFRKLSRDLEKHFYEYRYFSICEIRDIVKLARVTLCSRAEDSLEWLYKLHCVEFKDMHPEILSQLPHRINMVFTNGDYSPPWKEQESFLSAWKGIQIA